MADAFSSDMTQDEFQKIVLQKLEKVDDRLDRQEKSQKSVLQNLEKVNNRLDQVEKSTQNEFQNINGRLDRLEETGKDLLVSHDGLKFLIEHEVMERLKGTEEGLKVYTDYKISDHEKRLHSKRY